MDHLEVGRYRDHTAPTWTRLSRAGYDVCRDLLNTPACCDLLPDVAGRRGLDLGCGEGHNTRLPAGRGAAMAGVDIAAAFVWAAAAMLDTWVFSITPAELRATLPAFRVPRFRRTLSQWVNAVAAAGLVIEAAAEPSADEATARPHPEIADSRTVPLFLQLRCRRPQPT